MSHLVATRRLSSRHPGDFTLACGEHSFGVQPWHEGVYCLTWTARHEELPLSPAALPASADGEGLEIRELPDGWRMFDAFAAIRLHNEPFAVELRSAQGEPILGPIAATHEQGKLVLSGALAAGDRFFGLGEKPGYMDRRGRRYTMWNTDNTGPHVETDDQLYASIPFVIVWHAGQALGLLFDDPGRSTLDLGAADADAWRFEADGPGLRLFVIAGPTPQEVVRRYAGLTGHMPLPPRWSLGYHQSRWSYESADEVLEIAAQFRDRGIPADVIHLDIGYMDGYRVFTFGSTFPDPAQLTAKLAARGLRAVTIIDPGVKVDPGYPIYDELLSRGWHVRYPDGKPFVGPVWPGECLFPDFARPAARGWWGQQHKVMLDAGIAGFWNDMNEPAVFGAPGTPRNELTMPMEVVHGPLDAPVPHHRAHNLYASGMAQATREGLLQLQPDRRPFVISRAGYAGIQRHAMVWLGDNHAIWSHLELNMAMCLSMGLSGVPFVGPDVGGFMGDSTPELLIRWTQAGALTPFFRNHSALGTRRQEPWTFGARAEALCREAIALRYRLLPYVYGAFAACARDGLPIMRPMWLMHPEDASATCLFDQYYFGTDLLVAPVTRAGATHRMVYFPAGRWQDFHTGLVYEGPLHAVVEAPLERLPLFARAGSVLPMGELRMSTDEELETLLLRIFPAPELAGSWYDDDGLSLEHQRGGFNLWRFEGGASPGKLRLRLIREAEGYASPTRRAAVLFPCEAAPTGVAFAGEPVTGWNHARGTLTVPLLLLDGELVVSWG